VGAASTRIHSEVHPPPRLLPFRMLRDILFMFAACPSCPGGGDRRLPFERKRCGILKILSGPWERGRPARVPAPTGPSFVLTPQTVETSLSGRSALASILTVLGREIDCEKA
jgi:hypothetical protein